MNNHPAGLTYKYSHEFSQGCKEVLGHSPITFYSIGRVFKDGTYTGFMSDPTWTDLYLKKTLCNYAL